MEKDIKIREGNTSDLGDIMSISKSLADWFNEDGIKFIEQDFEFEKTILAEVDSKPIGFLSFFTYEGVGYLGWIGVYEDYHGSGAGKLLFDEFEKIMKKNDINTLQVKSLGESVLYPPYDRTRAFYKKVGFSKHRSEFTENPGCPEELILRKMIKPVFFTGFWPLRDQNSVRSSFSRNSMIPIREEIPIKSFAVAAFICRVVQDDMEVLLIQREKGYLGGTWQMVSGKIEKGEKAWEAALREIQEETGIIPDRFYSADLMEIFYEVSQNCINLCPVFVGFVDTEKEIVLSPEHIDFKWVPFRDIGNFVEFEKQVKNAQSIFNNFVLKEPFDFLEIPIDNIGEHLAAHNRKGPATIT